MAVTGLGETNNARVYEIAVQDKKGNFIPMGKTNPQRAVVAEQGEVIRVKVSGISRRQDGTTKWSLIAPTPIKPPSVPDRPSTIEEVERLWEKGK